MEARIGLLFLVGLGVAWTCDARHLGIGTENYDASESSRNDQVCTLCEEFTAKAVYYLSQNKTQAEIIEILHDSCSKLLSFKEECITVVDYYAPLFFIEIASINPEKFCKKVNLCQQIVKISWKLQEDSCVLCRRVVSELLVKLKDPDTELEIIEALLKLCNSMDSYAKKTRYSSDVSKYLQCKMMVFRYAPLILSNAEKFLETTDICTALHACNNASTINSKEVSFM